MKSLKIKACENDVTLLLQRNIGVIDIIGV